MTFFEIVVKNFINGKQLPENECRDTQKVGTDKNGHAKAYLSTYHSIFNNVSGVRPETLLKKRLQHSDRLLQVLMYLCFAFKLSP